MLPNEEALTGRLAHAGVIGTDTLSVVERPFASSVLPDIEASGLFVYAGCHQPPARCSGTMASADSPSGCPVGVSPGKSALLPGTTAAFLAGGESASGGTSATGPSGFVVLCQLAASRPAFYAVLVHRPASFP